MNDARRRDLGGPVISEEARTLAKVLWDYHHVGSELPSKVDLLLVAGSHDERVAEYSGQLWKKIDARVTVASGGFGKITSGTSSEPEGRRFKRIMEEHGVPAGVILSEETATNTGENLTRTRALLESHHIAPPMTAIIVTKPYMERRALATALKQWPEVSWSVASPEIGFEEYPTEDVPEMRMIELMVGDLQRIKLYGDRGFQIPQEIPEYVWAAYHELVALGFDRQVIKD
jgi:uncharacterized SAM-binding protein YcdF (DUF218 family)